MKSPICIFGGKRYMVKHILPLIPRHKTYVEVFGGGAWMLFAKEPSLVEVYNDIDGNLVDFFRILRDDNDFEEFYKLCICTPYSREIFYECRKDFREEEDRVKRAWKFFVIARMCFSGRFVSPSWATCVTKSCRKMSLKTSSWISSIEGLHDTHTRLIQVIIENQDFRKLIKSSDRKETFFYVDPPYVRSTRSSGEYMKEMDEEDHQDLVNILLEIKGSAILSGYKHPIYEPLEEAGWERRDYETSSFAAARTKGTGLIGEGSIKQSQKRIESLWISPKNLKNPIPTYESL